MRYQYTGSIQLYNRYHNRILPVSSRAHACTISRNQRSGIHSMQLKFQFDLLTLQSALDFTLLNSTSQTDKTKPPNNRTEPRLPGAEPPLVWYVGRGILHPPPIGTTVKATKEFPTYIPTSSIQHCSQSTVRRRRWRCLVRSSNTTLSVVVVAIRGPLSSQHQH